MGLGFRFRVYVYAWNCRVHELGKEHHGPFCQKHVMFFCFLFLFLPFWSARYHRAMATNHGKGVGASVLAQLRFWPNLVHYAIHTPFKTTIQARLLQNQSACRSGWQWACRSFTPFPSPNNPPFGIHSINSPIRTHKFFCWSCLPRQGYCV
jgi:hypothetical protein